MAASGQRYAQFAATSLTLSPNREGRAALNTKRRYLGFDKDPIYVDATGKRFEDVCVAKVVPLKCGQAQPFLLTPTPLKLDKARRFFSVAA